MEMVALQKAHHCDEHQVNKYFFHQTGLILSKNTEGGKYVGETSAVSPTASLLLLFIQTKMKKIQIYYGV